MTLPLPLIRSRGVAAAAAGFPAIRPTRKANPSVSLPQTSYMAPWVSPAPPAWSAWKEITAGEALSYILDKLNVNIMVLVSLNWWLQLGVGAVGEEAAFATFGGTVMAQGTNLSFAYPVQLDIDGYRLPANTRLSIRSRDDNSDMLSGQSKFCAVVVAMPDPPLFSAGWDEEAYRGGGVSSITRYPGIPSFTSVLSGAVDTWGGWVEFIAAAPNRLLVYTLDDSVGGQLAYTHRFQVGIGPKGEEVAHELTASPGRILIGAAGVGDWPLSRAVEALPGERVCVRHSNPTAARTAKVAVDAYNLNF